MGLYRAILALSVLLAHAGGIYGYFIIDGVVAVKCFLIMSGFYMALILNEKYTSKKSTLFLFYTNRIYRIMPLYIFFLLISILVPFICLKFDKFPLQTAILDRFSDYYHVLDPTTFIYIIFSNIFVVGREIGAFLGINLYDGTMYFTSSVMEIGGPCVNSFMFIPQAWTLSVEFYFYLLAPFIIKLKSRYIALLILLSFFIRFVLYYSGYNNLIWSTTFFPSEIGLFLLGYISYRIFIFLNNNNLLINKASIVFSTIIFGLTIFYPLLPRNALVPYFFKNNEIIIYLIFTIGLPFLFHQSKFSRIDRFLGELSYPIFLSHLFIIPFFGPLFQGGKSAIDIILIICITIALSSLSVIFIQKHVDHYRQNRL